MFPSIFQQETLEPTYLPSGDPDNDYLQQFVVRVTDKYDTYVDVPISTKVH